MEQESARARALIPAFLGLLAFADQPAWAGERLAAQVSAGIGAKPFPVAQRRGFDLGGHVEYRLHADRGNSLWIEGGADYRHRPANRPAFTSSSFVYDRGGELNSVSGSLRLKAGLLGNRIVAPYATVGLRVANDTSPEVFYAGGVRIVDNWGERSVTQALFEVGVGLRFRIANHHGIVTELRVDDGTRVFPGPVWSIRLGYRVGP